LGSTCGITWRASRSRGEGGGMKRLRSRHAIVMVLVALAAGAATFAGGAVAAPTPGVVAGGFCTYRTGYLATSTQAAQRINTYFAAGGGGGARFFFCGVW